METPLKQEALKGFEIEVLNETSQWHTHKKYKYNGKTLAIRKGVATGCGICTLSNIIDMLQEQSNNIFDSNKANNYKDLKIFFNKIKEDCLNDRIGLLICTLGDDYIKYQNTLLELNFIKAYEFQNWMHGENYKQTVFFYELKK